MGVTFFDTAQIYGPFSIEELVGEAIKGKRDGLVIATKFGFRFTGNEITGVDGTPANARASVEGSLKRLGIDCIDLFYQHRVDPAVPIEDTVGGLAELVKEGKIKHIGLSEAGPQTLAKAAAVAPITALQSEYSLWERDIEEDILPMCREHGVGFVPYSPLGRGFLTGSIKSRADLAANDWRLNDPRYSEENFAANMQMVDVLRGIAEAHDVSPAQIALAWLLAQKPWIVPIPGTTKAERLEENIGAAKVQLSADDLREIDSTASKITVQGDRYPEKLEQLTGR